MKLLFAILKADKIMPKITTEETKRFVEGITLEDIPKTETWKKLTTICRITPDEDVLPVRSRYGNKSTANIVLINQDTGMISKTTDAENTANKREKRSKERGKDSKPRNYPLHTMKNLPQFRNKSHEEVRQYILEKKGVDIGSNFRWNNTLVWILVALVAVAGGIGVIKWCQQRQMKDEM